MSANRFVLVPEDIYRGLAATDTGNINLDYSRRAIEKVKKEKTDPSTKNVRYNQELRRYLHLKKEHEDKPVKVELSGKSQQIINQEVPPTPSLTQSEKIPVKFEIAEFTNEVLMRIKSNPEYYQVTADDKIKNDHGKTIEGSNINKSIQWIIANKKGRNAGPRPKGTSIIENIISNDPTLKQLRNKIEASEESTISPKKKQELTKGIWD